MDMRRQIESFQPIVAVLNRKISGSMEGEAIQNDITGASGTPPIKSEEMTGITPQEHKGLSAPSIVAKKMDKIGFLFSVFLMILETPRRLTLTARGIDIRKYGHKWRNESVMNWKICTICSIFI